MRNCPIKKNLGFPRTSPQPPGSFGDLPGHRLGNPQDRPQTKKAHLIKFTAPEAIDCCIRILLLERIPSKTPLDRFVMYTKITARFLAAHATYERHPVPPHPPGPGPPSPGLQVAQVPRTPKPCIGIICICACVYIYTYIYTYICRYQI